MGDEMIKIESIALSGGDSKSVTGLISCGSINVYIHREEKSMSLSSHLQQLRRKHETLARKVEEAQRSPAIDGLEVSSLKKQKLALKQEIERLSA